jgi:hypothetical protein
MNVTKCAESSSGTGFSGAGTLSESGIANAFVRYVDPALEVFVVLAGTRLLDGAAAGLLSEPHAASPATTTSTATKRFVVPTP